MSRAVDRFQLMRVFQQVAHLGSFTKAAAALDMTTSSVSKSVSQLEALLSAKLLYRTTRQQSLTDSGRLYLKQAEQILAQLLALEEQVGASSHRPSGRLRITVPTALGQFALAPQLPQFKRDYPDIGLDLILSDSMLDMTGEGIDVAIRSVPPAEDAGVYALRLGSQQRLLVAAPEFLHKRGVPREPADLDCGNRSPCPALLYSGRSGDQRWHLWRNGECHAVSPHNDFRADNYQVLLAAAVGGLGIANLYDYMVAAELERGTLQRVLPDWQQSPRPRFAVYGQRRDLSPKLDAFLAFLEGAF